MSDRLATTIKDFLVNKGYGARPAEDAAELAGLLRNTSPPWDWSYIRIAVSNRSFWLSAIAIAVTLGLVLWLGDKALDAKARDKSWETALVAAWVVGPPIWFFIELYFRGHDKVARESIKPYQEAAQRIWLAVAAVLAALYGLSLKA